MGGQAGARIPLLRVVLGVAEWLIEIGIEG